MDPPPAREPPLVRSTGSTPPKIPASLCGAHEVCSCLPAVPMVVMMSPVSMAGTGRILDGRIGDERIHSIPHPRPRAVGTTTTGAGTTTTGTGATTTGTPMPTETIDPGVGGQGERETREPQDRDDTNTSAGPGRVPEPCG